MPQLTTFFDPACLALARNMRRGFSLVELLVTVAIVGMLVALLLPAAAAAREASRRASCLSNLRQLALALQEYENRHASFPAGRLGCDDLGETTRRSECPFGLSSQEKNGASGFVLLLPDLEQQLLFDQLAVYEGGLWNRNVNDLTWFDVPNKRRGIAVRPPIFVCPSDSSTPLSEVYLPVLAATSSYAFSQGTLGPPHPMEVSSYENDGLFLYKQARALNEVYDGPSNCLMLGEVAASDQWESSNTWTYALSQGDCLRSTYNPLNTPPGDGEVLYRRNGAFGSEHSGGAHFAFADGHAGFLQNTIDLSAYRALSTIAGSEFPTRK